MRRFAVILAGSICAALTQPAAAQPANAEPANAGQENGAPILVDAAPDAAQWSATASRRLDRNLHRARADMPPDIPDAIVQIRFELVDGQPANLRLMRSSGKPWLDRDAMEAIAAMDDLPALPAAFQGREVQANIITARHSYQARRLQRELHKSEAARLASAPDEAGVLTFHSG